jgi:acetyltransferase
MLALEREMPSHWSRANPVDLLGDAGPGLYEKALKVLLREKGVDGVVVILSPQAISKPLEVAKAVVAVANNSKKPVLACWLGGSFVEFGRKYLRENGLPGYRSPEVAVRAFAYMDSYRERMRFLEDAEQPAVLDVEPDREKIGKVIEGYLEKGRKVMTECNSKAVLREYGIPVNETLFAGNPKEAVERARKVGFPVVLKVVSDEITHKTEAGGVALGIASEKEVERQFRAITGKAKKAFPEASVLGVSVQRMVPMGKAELILGKKLDPIFGPVVLFGAGGITTEVFQDESIGLPPVNRKVAKSMIEKTKISKLFSGKKARVRLKKAELEKVLVRFSHFCVDFPQVKEVDINPLIVSGGKLYAVDARIILGK